MAEKDRVGVEAGKSYPSMKSRSFKLHFQQNRRKELVLKNRTLAIEPYGTAEITEEELNSPQFETQRHFFGVTEV